MFGRGSPLSKATEELDDIEKEHFILEKNMMHDQHRLAYIEARREHLLKTFPTLAPDHTTPLVNSMELGGRAYAIPPAPPAPPRKP